MKVQGNDPLPPEVRWTLGCLVSAAAMVGVSILVMLVAIALQPPTWVQVALGVGLAAGGAFFAWLVASALGQSRGREDKPAQLQLRVEDDSRPERDESTS